MHMVALVGDTMDTTVLHRHVHHTWAAQLLVGGIGGMAADVSLVDSHQECAE